MTSDENANLPVNTEYTLESLWGKFKIPSAIHVLSFEYCRGNILGFCLGIIFSFSVFTGRINRITTKIIKFVSYFLHDCNNGINPE